MRRLLMTAAFTLAFVFVGAAALPTPEARAETYVYYYDSHPIPDAFGGGFCYEEGAHYHVYAPVDLDFYSYHDGYYVFTGDPWFYGYSGDLYWYYDAHPVSLYWGVDVCYIVGPHRHWYTPHHNHSSWYRTGGYYYYRGDFPRHYRASRHVRLERRYPTRYRHYAERAPRTPPPARPPAADRVRSRRDDRPRYGGQAAPAPRASQAPDRPSYGGERGARSGDAARRDGDRPAARRDGDRTPARRDGDRPSYSGRPGRDQGTPPAASDPRKPPRGMAPTPDGRAPAAAPTKPPRGGTPGAGAVRRTTPERAPSKPQPAAVGRSPRATPSPSYMRKPTMRKPTGTTPSPRSTVTTRPRTAPQPTTTYRRTQIQRSRTPAMTGGTPSAKKRYYSPPSRSGGSRPAIRGGGGRAPSKPARGGGGRRR